MKSMIKVVGIAVVVLALDQTLQAVPITGSIAFSGDVTSDTSSAGNATEAVSFIDMVAVGGGSGSFSGIASGSTAIFTSGSWNFNTSTPIKDFWMVDGFTFNLDSSYIVTQGSGTAGGYVTIAGTGTVSGNGYAPTTMSWQFSTHDQTIISHSLALDSSYNGGTIWTFSTANATPDGGATVILLGIALSSVALLKKKFTA